MDGHRVSRREFLGRSAVIGGGALMATLAARPAGAAGQIVVTDPGGEWQEAAAAAYYRPFEKETGIKVLYSARPSLAMGRLKAMVEAKNVEWDVTILADYLMYRAGKDGLVEAIDYKTIDTSNVIKTATTRYGIGNDVFATVMAYNTKKWPAGGGPKTWADFWDVKTFPGRRSMSGIGYGPLEFALLADGAPLDKLYPLDVPRALKKMDEIKPHVKVWWTAGAQQAQLMAGDEVDLIQGWNGRFQGAIDKGAPFAINWNGVYQIEGWVVPKGAPNRDAATKFLDFSLKPEHQAEFAKRLPYGPVNQKALALLPPTRARQLPTFEANMSKLTAVDAEWVADHTDELQAKWTEWKVK